MSAYCTNQDCDYGSAHVHCVSCGCANPNGAELCAHHAGGVDEWARDNRVMNDLVHRKIEPPPVVLTGVIADSVGEDVAY